MSNVTIDGNTVFVADASAWPGVDRVAGWVADDLTAVAGGTHPVLRVGESGRIGDGTSCSSAVIYGTVGRSAMLDDLSARGVIDVTGITGKREVYGIFAVAEPAPGVRDAVVIAGSDKRGTIYGLLKFSELMGVSPLRNWSGIEPARRSFIKFDSSIIDMVSREPSVRYRGFFINDEWPAFGNWSRIHFGGANVRCYERVFELLLRLKGNYLWPAMWIDNFSLDGPGLASAKLADELGVVMSTSHHEPCMRTGEEYGLMRGADSPYGDAWDFLSNAEGITRFWRDGLRRNKAFENVITMGMRGERDTAIMQNATREQNIDLIRNVLAVQNRLMREELNPDLSQVPRQIVLFSEVEEFFYPDENGYSLVDDPELNGVTIMLADNNVGYARTLPQAQQRDRNGGWGMYYHMDMHGGPASYEWIGSTWLPRVWDQMSCAYDAGVREIWVVNVGDIATNEMSLAYFLDMAYDMDRYGTSHPNNHAHWLDRWVSSQFAEAFSESDIALIRDVMERYMTMLERRKHEVMKADSYHPTHYGEAQELRDNAQWVMSVCDGLRARCPEHVLPGFIELVWYPAMGTANLMNAWVLAGRNALYAEQNRVSANALARQVSDCLDRDEEIVRVFHTVGEGKFDGLGLSEHFGFRAWCADNNQYPVTREVRPACLPRMVVSIEGSDDYSVGSPWTGSELSTRVFDDPRVESVDLSISNGGRHPIDWRIESDCEWLRFSRYQGSAAQDERVTVSINRAMHAGVRETGHFTVIGRVNGTENGYAVPQLDDAKVPVTVVVDPYLPADVAPGTFLEVDGVVAIEAEHYAACENGADGSAFVRLAPYGKTGTAMKVLPHMANFDGADPASAPWLEYRFAVRQTGEYDLAWVMAPTMPVSEKLEMLIATQINDGEIRVENTVEDTARAFFMSPQHERESIDNVREFHTAVACKAGENRLRFRHISPNTVLERLVLVRDGVTLPVSYLGPKESPRY